MPTIVRLGPADHGRALTLEEFLSGDYQEGHKYELIDGRLYVSPQANMPADILERWVTRLLDRYAEAHPEVIDYVTPKARVFVPDRPDLTCPEPDLAAYQGVPLGTDYRTIRWEDYSPLLVVEVLSEDDPNKDLVRNARLYRLVSSIREYWVVDPRPNPNRPTLVVHRRSGQRWRRIRVAFGETYSTPLLPGFELIVDPRR